MSKAQLTRENILKVAARLFAENGIKATTVRDICQQAGVTHNMVTHHFGSKDSLLNELILRYANGLFPAALKIIEEPAKNKADFETKFRSFQKESLASALEHRDIIIVFTAYSEKEKCGAFPAAVQAALDYQKALLGFLKRGVEIGAVRADADVEMITATLWDRIVVQVRYADWLKSVYGDNNILNPDFRRRWLKANVDAHLYGILSVDD